MQVKNRPARQSAESSDGAPEALSGERITVALVAKVSAELRRLMGRTGLSKTDAVNRAITAYEYIEGEMAKGSELVLRQPGADVEQVIKFL
jgi:hypothetical protein